MPSSYFDKEGKKVALFCSVRRAGAVLGWAAWGGDGTGSAVGGDLQKILEHPWRKLGLADPAWRQRWHRQPLDGPVLLGEG